MPDRLDLDAQFTDPAGRNKTVRKRAGRWARETTRRTRLTYIRVNWFVLVQATLLYVAIAGFSILLISITALSPVRPYAAGAFVVGYFWLMTSALDAADGTSLRRLGGEAERWVSDDLRRLRRSGWVVVDHIPFRGHDVDHFLVGPGGAWVIETKRSSVPVRLTGAGIRGVYAGDPCIQARQGASKIRGLLRSEGLDIGVRAAVVVAGPGSSTLPSEPTTVVNEHGEALVVALRDLRRNVNAFSKDQLTTNDVQTASRIVGDFIQRRDAYEQRTGP